MAGWPVTGREQLLAERLPGPTVLAGHCYGGAVISGAATGVEKVIGLVFASAFAPDEGERLGGLNAQVPPPAWTTLPSWFLVSTKDRMINYLLGVRAGRTSSRRRCQWEPASRLTGPG